MKRAGWPVLSVVLSFVLSCLVVAPSFAASELPVPSSPVGSVGRIAYTWAEFTRTPDGFGGSSAKGIASRALDGSDARMHSTASGTTYEGEPSWSPDGRWLVFTRMAGGGDSVQISGVDGTARTLVDQARSAQFSPDGAHIAYSRDDGLFIAPVVPGPDGPQVQTALERRLAPVPARPGWHPSGTMLAYVHRVAPDVRHGDLMRVGLDGAAPVRMTSGLPVGLIESAAPVWSPDGTTVAFMTDQTETHNEAVWVAGLTSPARKLTSSSHEQGFSWHPSGEMLAVDTAAAASFDLVSPRGALLRRVQLQGIGDPGQAVFTPDGASVLLVAQPAGLIGYDPNLYAVGLDGAVLRQLTDDNSVFPDSVRTVSVGLTSRIAGGDRIATAARLARSVFSEARDVVLARADAYADGLVGGPLAGALRGPLLLTDRDRLPDVVRDELRRLGAARVHLVGGAAAVSETVADAVRALGIEVDRVDGADQFALAAAVAARIPGRAAFLVQGAAADPQRGWPDAVAVSGLAAHLRRPILLTPSDALPAATERALRDGGVTQVTIVGGPAAVSDAVAERLTAMGIAVDRLSGPNRYETSRAVALRAEREGMDAGRPYLVTGRSWPDSLAAGPAAAITGGVVLLVDGEDLSRSPAAEEWLRGRGLGGGATPVMVGGLAAVSSSSAAAVEHVLLR